MDTQSTPKHTLWVNGNESIIEGIDHLRERLLNARQLPHSDIWIEREGGGLLTLMVNGDHSWLMFLRHRGDSGLNSRNLGFTGSIDSKLEFIHDTGERRSYPQTWVVPSNHGFEAVEFFFEHGAPSPAIAWHDTAAELSGELGEL